MTALPSGFLFGSATAGHQIEGGNVNADLWPKEWAAGSMFTEPSGDACDSYHRYGEDIALLAAAGLNAYRFSVEWSRIEPELGWYSRAALDHYKRMLETCHAHGVTPMVTLHHFTAPRWFGRVGGWGGDGAAERFARYAERVTQHMGDLMPYVCTINEANILSTIFNVGMAPAGERDHSLLGDDDHSALAEVAANIAEARETPEAGMGGWPHPEVSVMAAAHHAARSAIKAVRPDTKVGWSLALIDVQAVEGGEERCANAVKAAQLDWLDVSVDDDFVGVQTYSRERMSADGLLPRPEGSEQTLTGWEFYPVALEHTLRLAAEKAKVPLYVTENGIATGDDSRRIAYTTGALQAMGRCIDDGLDVRGYFHWTLLDNFEWVSGFRPTFGLIAVNRETFERTPKPSLAWLGNIARTGVLP
jgi:beta-glucosidase